MTTERAAYTIRYEGPPAFTSLLAGLLREEGAEVTIADQPSEVRTRDLMASIGTGAASSLIVYVLTRPKGEVPAIIEAAVERFQRRGRGTIRLEHEGKPLKVWTSRDHPE